VSGRELFVSELSSPGDIVHGLTPPSPYFVCHVAWNAAEVGDATISQLVQVLVRAGCVYICCWGSGCERVHDFFDEADLERSQDGPFATSTWHENEPLSEATWFTLFNTFPDDAFSEGCRATLGITIGSAAWAADVRRAFEERARGGRALE
jgi:hypothetical protein